MRVLALMVVVLSSPSAFADRIEIPHANDLLRASGIVQLRNSSPDPTFGGQGAQVGWLKGGELVRVKTVKQYISVFGTEIWVEVARDGHESTAWVKAGLARDLAGGKSLLQPYDLETAAMVEGARILQDGEELE